MNHAEISSLHSPKRRTAQDSSLDAIALVGEAFLWSVLRFALDLKMQQRSEIMDNRTQREKQFHDHRFSKSHFRSSVKRYYAITRTIGEQYKQFLKYDCPDARVLDYGCGTGSYSIYLANSGADVTGIDISRVALHVATTNVKQRSFGANIKFIQMDAEKLGFDDDSFDLVCGGAILHHLALEKAIREISRVLRPEGKAVFVEPLGHNVFINAFRRLTPGIRTADEHPLLELDLALLKRYFREMDVSFFYFFALGAAPFVGLPGFNSLLGLLESVDQQLFKLPFLRRQAWQVLVKLSAPMK